MKIEKLLIFLYYLLVFFLPYLPFLGELLQIPFGLFVNILTLIIVFILIIKGVNKLDIIILILIIILFLSILLLRITNYIVPTDEIAAFRFPLLIIVYYFITKWMKEKSILDLDRLKTIIIFNSSFQALLGIARYFIFPEFNFNYLILDGASLEEFILAGGATRETGLLLNANTFANLLLLGLFIVLNNGSNKNNKLVNYIIFALLFSGILISQSRFAIGMSFLYMIIIAIKRITPRKAIFIIPLATLVIIFLLPIAEKMTKRGYLYEDRANKNQIALNILNKNTKYYLIGAPFDLINKKYGNDISDIFSDNSYLSMVLSFGIPISIIYFLFFLSIFYKNKDVYTMFFFVYMIILLGITNCIYWNYWVLYIFPTFYLISRKIDDNKILKF